MRPLVKLFVYGSVPLLIGGGWILQVEGTLNPARQQVTQGPADNLALRHFAAWESASIRAADGVRLEGWLFTPKERNRRAVLMVHGGAGSRRGMLNRAAERLDAGYTCLLIDQRGCGTSGGSISKGVREPEDVNGWARWLRVRTGAGAVYGYGVSRGGTTVVQSLAVRPELDAVVAECAGIGASGHGYALLSEKLGISERLAGVLLWPMMESAYAWVQWRHGWDMRQAPLSTDAVRGRRIPLLLIHGTDDEVNPIARARQIRLANPAFVELWPIPGGEHELFRRHGKAMMAKTVEWFAALSAP